MTNSRVVLFDLDGTITDSAPGIIACIRYALADMGLEGPDDNAMRSFLGPPLVDTFINHFGVTPAESTRMIAKYRERYHDVGEYENAVYPGLPEILANHLGTPLFWLPAEAVYNTKIVADYPWPGAISGTWTHVENIKAAK